MGQLEREWHNASPSACVPVPESIGAPHQLSQLSQGSERGARFLSGRKGRPPRRGISGQYAREGHPGRLRTGRYQWLLQAVHAAGFPRPMRCASIILPGGEARRLTELSNVVAYACRHSRAEDRRMAFFGDPSTGDQSFGIQSFPSAESDRGDRGAGRSPGAVDWRIACGNCGNPSSPPRVAATGEGP
jgi:hypothetical protein